MGVAGSISPSGGAPRPDPERVATLRYTLVDEAETCAAFGEGARATLASLNERTLAETRAGDLGECMLLLDHVRDRVAGLDPSHLAPRTGLAGLFDSRSKRLKAFRATYASAAAAVTQSAAEIGDRAGALARKEAALETLWSDTRVAISELDAHIAAARDWLVNEVPAAPAAVQAPAPQEDRPHADAAPVEDMAAADPVEIVEDAAETTLAEAVSEAETSVPSGELSEAPEPAPLASLPHPLEIRLTALEAVRKTAIGRLPLLRATQNADYRAPAALKQVCDGVEGWRADWHDALGLAGKRPKTVQPDRARLTAATSALTDRIDAVCRELSAVQARRAELGVRSAPAKAATALAA